jgi:AraC-like DNA-binding protein
VCVQEQFKSSSRLQHAQELLHRGGLGCAEIANRCGFGSLPAFSRSFKQRLGMPPTQWLARLRKSVEEQGAPFQPWRG